MFPFCPNLWEKNSILYLFIYFLGGAARLRGVRTHGCKEGGAAATPYDDEDQITSRKSTSPRGGAHHGDEEHITVTRSSSRRRGAHHGEEEQISARRTKSRRGRPHHGEDYHITARKTRSWRGRPDHGEDV